MIGAITLAAGALFVVGALALIVISPTERIATLDFRLSFQGAENNKYPNDTPFSPAEIVATPVIAEVFRANDLQRYGQFETFKNALFIQQTNLALDMLEADYNARLSDARLTAVDRARLEEEFRIKREAALDPSFSISLRRSERLTELPKEFVQKILGDTLATWARQADQLQGVTRYQVPVLSSELITRQTIENSDYLVAADRIRARAVRILSTIEEMAEVPGALTIRTADSASLPEIRGRLENILRFDLEPLIQFIRAEGITKEARLLAPYASSIAFQLQLDQQEAQARARALQNSLRDYVAQGTIQVGGARETASPSNAMGTQAVVPQLSESFLDRLGQMSVLAQDGEMEYRRALTDRIIAETRQLATIEKELGYYRGLESAVQTMNRSGGSAETVAVVTARTLAALDAIEKATSQLSTLYEEISARNLNPAARLYEITGPVNDTSHGTRSIDRLAIALAFVLLGTLLIASLGTLVYAAVHGRRPVSA